MKIEPIERVTSLYFKEVVEWLRQASKGDQIRISDLPMEFTGASISTIFNAIHKECDIPFSVSRGDNSRTPHSYIITKN